MGPAIWKRARWLARATNHPVPGCGPKFVRLLAKRHYSAGSLPGLCVRAGRIRRIRRPPKRSFVLAPELQCGRICPDLCALRAAWACLFADWIRRLPFCTSDQEQTGEGSSAFAQNERRKIAGRNGDVVNRFFLHCNNLDHLDGLPEAGQMQPHTLRPSRFRYRGCVAL
jgi:hypothetical protein